MRTKWTYNQAMALVGLFNTFNRLEIYSPKMIEIHNGNRLDIWDDRYYSTIYFEDEV